MRVPTLLFLMTLLSITYSLVVLGNVPEAKNLAEKIGAFGLHYNNYGDLMGENSWEAHVELINEFIKRGERMRIATAAEGNGEGILNILSDSDFAAAIAHVLANEGYALYLAPKSALERLNEQRSHGPVITAQHIKELVEEVKGLH